MSKLRNEVVKFSVFVFLFICIFFPGDNYHIKLVGFFLACVFSADVLLKNLSNRRYRYIYIMGIGYPIVALVWSYIINGNFIAAAKQIYPASLVLLVIVIMKFEIEYDKWLITMLMIIAFVTLGIAILDISGILPFYSEGWIKLFDFMFYNEMGGMAITQKGFIHYVIFFKCSPLLVILLTYSMKNRKYWLSLLTIISLYLSGTRANLFAGLLVIAVGFVIVINERFHSKWLKYMLVGIAIVGVIGIMPYAVRIISNMQNDTTAALSDSMKIGQGIGIIKELKNPRTLFFGQGFGSLFADMGRGGALQEAAELNYLDFLRKAGLILSLPFFAFITYPFTWKIEWDKKLALLGYLAICATNPYLFTSTSYILYIWIYMKKPEETWLTQKIIKSN